MTIIKQKDIFRVFQKVLYDNCVDKNYISQLTQIVEKNNQAFSAGQNFFDVLRLNLQYTKELTQKGTIGEVQTGTTEIKHLKLFCYRMKYTGNNSQFKLDEIRDKLLNSQSAKITFQHYGIHLHHISDVEDISVDYDNTFYDQSFMEVKIICYTKNVLNEEIIANEFILDTEVIKPFNGEAIEDNN